jgi:uncharacterized protein (TIGR00266 family)
MQHQIDFGPAYSLATLKLDAGESVKTEAGAMVTMGPGLEIQTGTGGGGILGGLKRAALGGESFFMNTFSASAPAELSISPALPGDIAHYPMSGETLYLTSGNYLASDTGLDVDTKWGGAKTFFSGEGLFLLKVSGQGSLFASAYGAIQTVELVPDQVFTVDTGHVVGFTDGVGYNVRKFGGIKSTLLGGEGLVAELTGPGTAWVQTRSPRAFLDWLLPLLPKDRSS